MHPNNRHHDHYDFDALCKVLPELRPHVRVSTHGAIGQRSQSIDFADPSAVRALNQALLACHYQIHHWHLPDGYLCPPIPGRADYLHCVADLIAFDELQSASTRPKVLLDIGVGANCIYPLLGHALFGWQFVGSDVESKALEIAQRCLEANQLQTKICLRQQNSRGKIFHGVIGAQDQFAATVCNPPFYANEKEARQNQSRKLAGLGLVGAAANFGGQDAELWCTGGEASFIKRMTRESKDFAHQVRWFTTLVARSENLPEIYKQLKKVEAKAVETIGMSQGGKQSRLVAWRF